MKFKSEYLSILNRIMQGITVVTLCGNILTSKGAFAMALMVNFSWPDFNKQS